MFTGLIEATGRVTFARKSQGEMDLGVEIGGLSNSAAIGDSIALSGVCCTVTRLQGKAATFRLSVETLRRTWMERIRPGSEVNLEAALRAGDPMGGHIVQGHVDATGTLDRAIDPRTGGELCLRVPAEVEKYCVIKGSIAIDGVSLTLAAVERDRVRVAVIPHTAQVTTLGRLRNGDRVNLEVDILAKYVEKLVGR